MNNKKGRVLISALLVVLAVGVTVAWAYFTATDSASNKFRLANEYTLEYHANTGDTEEDANIIVPEKQSQYENGEEDVVFDVSTEKPVRPGYVFMGWYDKENPASDDTKYGDGGVEKYTAEQKKSHLYAKWTAGYTLIYDANGGANAPETVTAISSEDTHTFSNLESQGQMTGPPQADGTDSNRIFLGWSEDKNAVVPSYTSKSDGSWEYTGPVFDGDNSGTIDTEVVINAEDNPSKTVTLYAIWATKYELKFDYHPDMLAMDSPKCGTEKPDTMTLISATKKAHTFNLPSNAEAEAANIIPTRTEGYRWGWWGDNLERFKFTKPGDGQTAVQAGNEGCYQFGEPVPARPTGDTTMAPNYDNPVLTLYAYFQPPAACSITFNSNARINEGASNERDNPKYPGLYGNGGVSDMPDNAGASTTEQVWSKDIPAGEDNTPKHQRWVFVGWSEDRNADEAQYQPGDVININKVLKNRITLYAVWKPMHTYRLTFNRGYKNSRGNIEYTGTNEYYVQKASGQWKKGGYNIWFDSKENEYEVTSTQYFTDTSYTWPEGFFSKRGFFATKDDDSVGTYKFLGWSWVAQAPSVDEASLQVDFPVTIPDNPDSILNTVPEDGNTVGVVKEAITVEEGTPCTTPTRHDHVLYAVYRKSPKHQLKVTFNKGEASNTSGSLEHYIDINGVRQNKDSYYASLDYQAYTWDVTYWASNTPTATKNKEADDTATYTFLGWTTDESQKTPSTTITKDDIDYPVDDNGKITKAITVSEEANTAAECAGGTHEIKLWPVFRKNLFHVYQLNYDVNAPSTADGIVTKLYDNLSGSWKSVQVFPDPTTMTPAPDPMPDKGEMTGNLYSETKVLTETSWTWDMSGKGFFATCENTGSTPTGKMTFLGWSNKKFKLGEYDPSNPPTDSEGNIDTSIKFYPISAPVNPADPQGAGVFEAGTEIKIDVDEHDPKPADACTDDKGKVHKETLYGVWSGEPIHQYSIIFAGNSDKAQQDDVEVLYGKKADWNEYRANGTDSNLGKSKVEIKNTYKKDDEDIPVKYYDGSREVELSDDLKNTYRVFSEVFTLPKTDPDKTDSYTFQASFWNNTKDLIVEARRTASADTRYIFTGWNTEPDGTGTSITVDRDGYITSPLEIKDTDYDHCDGYTHNLILYAQWDDVKIHNFRLIFSRIDANNLGYYDNGTWRSVTATYFNGTTTTAIKDSLADPAQANFIPSTFNGNDNTTAKYDAEGSAQKSSYSWGETGDSAAKLRVAASKNSETDRRYEFVGWSKTKKEPSLTNSPSDVDYTVDANGYIQEKITITEPAASCEKSTHTLVLYPVFKIVPIHNFSVTLDRNGGSGLRAYNANNNSWSSSSTYTYNYPNANGAKVDVTENSYTWTVADFWSTRGFSAYRNQDSNYTYEFVGWSTEAVAASENPDMSNAISWTEHSRTPSTSSNHPNEYVNGFINQNITAECEENPCTGGEHKVTLYAIWKRAPRTKTYTLKLDANGGENAPEIDPYVETYNGSAWINSRGFTLTNAQIIASGMKNEKKVFVGWHENSGADNGKYGERNTANTELEQLTQGLTNPYTISIGSSSYSIEKTLYAIWWYEYQLDYDANGGSNAPEHDHAYTSDNYYPFRISSDKPTHADGYTFLGWSETKTTPGQGTETDVQFKSSTSSQEVRFRVNAEPDPVTGEMGYTGKKLYAVWGPAN